MVEPEHKYRPDPAPQVKICGLTQVSPALVCARAGADAVGVVFYPPSPRHVSLATAAAICRALPAGMGKVGVFVNASYAAIMGTVESCGLTGVQLHGQESPALVARLRRHHLAVIKALFLGGAPAPTDAARYDVSAYLLECARGKLPGGNAQTWDWTAAGAYGAYMLDRPVILAGGLAPDNVDRAIAAARPDGVDISSGVESAPGRKDPHRIKQFMAAVAHGRPKSEKRSLFLCQH